MPRVPQYQASQGVPRGGIGVMDAINLSTPYANVVANVGNMLQHRGEQLLKEYDATNALQAFNELRALSRDKVNDLLQREGSKAQGVQAEYNEWNKQTLNTIETNSLTTYSQKEMFQKLANQHKEADLDNLARHEAHQHAVYKGQVIKGLAEVTERDTREAAFDDPKVDGMIGNYFAALDGLFPGKDTTADKVASMQVFRVAQVESLIDQNPKYAKDKLEEFKADLGDKYYPLKKRLEAQTKTDELTQAFAFGEAKFGTNYHAAAHYFAQEKNFKEWGGDYAKSKELNSHFNSLASQREREEDHAVTMHNRRLQENDFKFWIQLNDPDPKAPRPDANALAKKGLISKEAYLAWVNKKESATSDNTEVYTDLYSKFVQGLDIRKDLAEANKNGLLSDNSTKALGKAYFDESHKSAYRDIKDAIDPGDLERTPDRALKFYDANKKLEARIMAGEDPKKAAKIVIDEYSQGLRRTLNTLPQQTENFKGDRKDRAQIENALRIVASKMATAKTEFDFKKYQNEYETLQKILQNAREVVIVDDTLERQRQEDAKKSRLPGRGY